MINQTFVRERKLKRRKRVWEVGVLKVEPLFFKLKERKGGK